MLTAPAQLWIKICGIRDVDTAVRVAELGADAIGLNFYAGSPRCVSNIDTATQIVAALPSATTAVGVFVNHSAAEIRQICEQTGLTSLQLHGDEPNSLIGELAEFHVIRALRIAGAFRDEAAEQLASYDRANVRPSSWLVDARIAGAYGGTGHTVDWDALAPPARSPDWPPLILAGGLTPDNVAEAVRIVQPFGVDVASGVESAPGMKVLSQVERFIDACR